MTDLTDTSHWSLTNVLTRKWYGLKKRFADWLQYQGRRIYDSLPCPYGEYCSICEYCNQCMEHGEGCIDRWEGNRPILK
jgi:hypothetical protein